MKEGDVNPSYLKHPYLFILADKITTFIKLVKTPRGNYCGKTLEKHTKMYTLINSINKEGKTISAGFKLNDKIEQFSQR